MTRAVAATGLAGCIAAVAASTVSAGSGDGPPDLRVALLTGGRCGELADSLPTLVARDGLRPGDVAGDVVVCVVNAGEPGALSLRATELVDVDSGCATGEAPADTSCGGGGAGELSPALLGKTAVGRCPSRGLDGAVERRLPELAADPLVLRTRMATDQRLCVRIRLVYRPRSDAEAAVSQTDRTTWRYAFVLDG